MLKLIAILAMTCAATPALAGASDWQELAPGARARLITSDIIVSGRTLVGLELDMPQSTRTYWRIPGETGIPTMLDFSASTGVRDTEIQWPYPEINTADGYLDYIYRGPVVLPVDVVADAGGVVDVSVIMGICTDVCMPARAHFTLPLGDKPDAAQTIRLNQALATVPIEWDHAGMPFGTVSVGARGLTIAAPDAAIEPQSVIADIGDPGILFGAPQKSPDTDLWTLPLLGGADGVALAGRTVQLTFMTASGPYVVSRIVAGAS